MEKEISFQDDGYISPLEAFFKEEWEQLRPHEKSLCVNYKRQQELSMSVTADLMRSMALIHERYPDFHVGCIP